MAKHRGSSAARRELLQRFAALPEKERLGAYEEMRSYLAADLGKETDEDRLIEREQEALAVLEKVAAHLRANGELADDAAPTASQFDRAARDLDLRWDRSRITRVFGLWRNAKLTLLGEHLTEGRAQRRFRLEQAGPVRTLEEYLPALRLWLETKLEGRSREDYDRWVTGENKARAKQGERPLPKAGAIRSGLGLPWSAGVAVARGELDLEQAREQRVDDLILGCDDRDLVGHAVIAAMFARTPSQTNYHIAHGWFPQSVAKVAGARAWFLGDILAYRDDREVRHRAEDEHQGQIMDTAEFSKRSGLTKHTIHSYIHRKLWSRLLEPDGQIGRHHYWSRDRAEKWLAGRKSARSS
jgi:hypothetical protein